MTPPSTEAVWSLLGNDLGRFIRRRVSNGAPFDRMLVSQALREDLPIVSSDSALDAYPITRIW